MGWRATQTQAEIQPSTAPQNACAPPRFARPERLGGAAWQALTGLMAIIAVVMLLCYVMFLMAERMSRLLGTTGNLLLTRMLGVVLAALAVQFAINGVLTVGK
jgi:small neutral amino acid transporter SnatA (MarC family)